MKRIISLLLAALMLLSLAACGDKTDSDSAVESVASYGDAGTYEILAIVDGSTTVTRDELLAGGLNLALTLEAAGTGVLDYGDGDKTSLTWEDGTITLDGEKLAYNVDDDMLVMDLSDSDGVYILTFQPAAAQEKTPSTGEEKGKSKDTDASLAGYYAIISIEENGSVYTREDLKLAGMDGYYLELRAGGEGTVHVATPTPITWDDGAFYADGQTVPLTWEDDMVTFTVPSGEVSFRFQKIRMPGIIQQKICIRL